MIAGTVNDPFTKPLTIAGRIPVKVTSINGKIKTEIMYFPRFQVWA
jgi:hypothetical protein